MSQHQNICELNFLPPAPRPHARKGTPHQAGAAFAGSRTSPITRAKAGAQRAPRGANRKDWIPAFAGMSGFSPFVPLLRANEGTARRRYKTKSKQDGRKPLRDEPTIFPAPAQLGSALSIIKGSRQSGRSG